MDYRQSREYIEDAQQYGSVLGLDGMRELMNRLGNPQNELNIIHVAGTNGKGSVIAYLYTVLSGAGYRTGRYISPTLYSYRERMEAAGTVISREKFARHLTTVAAAIEEMVRDGRPHPTPFEIETAVAFLFFREEQCDPVLLEVGLGGSLDATNVIPPPVLAVLTSISVDHQAYLGNTLAEIAEKKAGIFKSGSRAVTAAQKPEVMEVLRRAAEEKQVPLTEADTLSGKILSESYEGQTFSWHGEEYHLPLAGACQMENAILSLEALTILNECGYPTSLEVRKEGLRSTRWNGRFTVIHRKPLMVVDGAHNPGAAEKLAQSIERYFKGKTIYFLMGMFRDKDCRSVISQTCSYGKKIFTIAAPDNPRALTPEELAAIAREFHPDVEACGTIEEGVEKVFQAAGEEDVIIAFGSLAFIGRLTEIVGKREEKGMIDLQECRKEIDRIDDEIIQLFEKRMKVCEDVARYKIRTGKQVLDPQREREKIEILKGKAHGEFNALGAQELFHQIMAISRKRQYQLLTENGVTDEENFEMVDSLSLENSTVVFQGVKGAYSYAAMQAYFGEGISSYHVKTWRDAMEDVAEGKADYGVLPIENSTAGIVADIYDLLTEFPLYIVGEQVIRVDHVLLGLPGAKTEDIRTVYSHPQGLSQCGRFLERHREWKTVEMENTAGAAQKVKEDKDPSQAAIASREAGKVFGLSVLEENICHNGANVTRFIIVSRNPVYQKDSGKISIYFELPHESGTLYSLLSHMIYNGLNMTKIESRPIPGKTWEYGFFVDFEGNLRDSAVKNALRGLEAEANRVKVLGNYSVIQ